MSCCFGMFFWWNRDSLKEVLCILFWILRILRRIFCGIFRSGNPNAVGYMLSEVLTVLSFLIQCVNVEWRSAWLCTYSRKKKPSINANLSQSHSVPSHAVPACSWLEQALAPRSVTLGLSPRVPVAIANARRNAWLALPALAMDKLLIFYSIFYFVGDGFSSLQAPEARVKRSAERWRLATSILVRVCESEGYGTRFAKPEGRDSRWLADCSSSEGRDNCPLFRDECQGILFL